MSSAMDEVVVATVDETLVEANIIDTDMSGTIVVAAGESAFRHFGLKTDTYTSRRFGAIFVAWKSGFHHSVPSNGTLFHT